MKFLLASLMLLVFLPSCTMVLTEASKPEVRYIITPLTMEETYARAYRTAAKMGAAMIREEPQAHTFVARYKEAIALHVHVNRVEEGTQMTVTGSILPTYIAVGVLTEVEDFISAYRKEAYATPRTQ